MAIRTIQGKKFNVIPLYGKTPFKKSKYEARSDGEVVKSKRLRQIEKGMININE